MPEPMFDLDSAHGLLDQQTADTMTKLIEAVEQSPDKDLIIDMFKGLAFVHGHTFEDLDSINKFFSRQAVPMIDVQQIIKIAKIACKVIHGLDTYVCPLVNQLPG